MNTEQLEKIVYRIQPEIVILDSDERIVLLAQAQVNKKKQGDTSEVISWLKAGNGAISFVMFIDLETIQFFKWNSADLSKPVCIINTAEVLIPYGLNLASKWIFRESLGSPAESWLSDLRHHWKLEKPPAEEQMATIGLLPLLKDGTTQPEVEIRIDSKLRYIVLRYYHPRLDSF